MRILVVSNLGLIRHTIEQTLDVTDHTLRITENVQQALELLRDDRQIELIICEWTIRNLTAYDLFQSYRQIDRLSDVGDAPDPYFIIFRTPDRGNTARGSGERKDPKAESLLTLGCAEFLDKPIDRAILLRRIQEIQFDRMARKSGLSLPSSPKPAPASSPASFIPVAESRTPASAPPSAGVDPQKVATLCQDLLSRIESITTNLSDVTRTLEVFHKDCAAPRPHLSSVPSMNVVPSNEVNR